MKILLIEDDDFKGERIGSFLVAELPDHHIERARSYKSGLRSLSSSEFALVILDMTLPTYDIQPGADGGRPMKLGGRELLRQMKRRLLGYPVVVVTGFDTFGSGSEATTLSTLDEDLATEFGGIYRGSVYFNATSDEWRDHLRLAIKSIDTLEL
ncbi:hypothetical protein J5N58_20810 [Rhizobium cremeum]|uniref:hypothetical protein n=1 Tax=Rhizobium cremeum TaxID=2813827 RepID=UPI001FD133A9|nr:hypothetical protein [Rhizobium cremeum]MCJ7996909.1 hypothetical protein [Rhizobium cremeum]MCJ8002127.1 hypothetical protein [Rhizobium cremeum]